MWDVGFAEVVIISFKKNAFTVLTAGAFFMVHCKKKLKVYYP